MKKRATIIKTITTAIAIIIALIALLVILLGLGGCGSMYSEADIANSNITKQSGYFECERRVTVYNARTDKVIMYIEEPHYG